MGCRLRHRNAGGCRCRRRRNAGRARRLSGELDRRLRQLPHAEDAAGKPSPEWRWPAGTCSTSPFGRAVSPNITPDPDTGVGKWTDAQLVTALRDGKRPDGTTIGPPMPIDWYRKMSDDDAAAIVAYMQSVKPIHHAVGEVAVQDPAAAVLWAAGRACDGAAAHRQGRLRRLSRRAGRALHGVPHAVRQARPARHEPPRRRRPRPPGCSATEARRSAATSPPTRRRHRQMERRRHQARDHAGVRPDGTKLAANHAVRRVRQDGPADLNAIVAYIRSLKPVK